MPKKTVERKLKSLRKKYSKLKRYAEQLEKKLEEKEKSSKPSDSGNKRGKDGAAKSQTAKVKATTTKRKPAAAAPTAAKDNLKKIRGIGAVLEKKLNAAGITRFAQIAKWTAESMAKLPEELNLGTRPQRDDWIGQAKNLA